MTRGDKGPISEAVSATVPGQRATMTYEQWRNLKKPFVYEAKGVPTNMVYDDSGQEILLAPEPSDERDDDGPISEAVSATMPG